MDLVVRRVMRYPNLSGLSVRNDKALLLSNERSTAISLHIAELTGDEPNKNMLTIPDFISSHSDSSSKAYLGDSFIYVSSSDGKLLYYFSSLDSSLNNVSNSRLQTGFDSTLIQFLVLKDKHPSQTINTFILVVSQTAEIALINESGERPVIRKMTAISDMLDDVSRVSQVDHDTVALLGFKSEKLTLSLLKFHNFEHLETVEISTSCPILIPSQSESSQSSIKSKPLVIDFALRSDSACVLYEGGCVQFLKPQVDNAYRGVSSGADFHKTPFDPNIKAHSFTAVPSYMFTLTAFASADTNPAQYQHSGFVASIWDDYFAIGYHRHVSIWDGKYNIGHAHLQVYDVIRFKCGSAVHEKLKFATDFGLQELSLLDAAGAPPLTLGMAMKRKETCADLIESIEQDFQGAPMRCQPLSVGPVKAAADAQSNSARIFDLHIKSEEERENGLIRDLLSKTETPTAESMLLLIRDVTTAATQQSRRKPLDSLNHLGLRRLPSERLAAVTVARCLYEIKFGDSKFVVPLIDMVSTGVVSSEAVLAVVDVSDSWEMGAGKDRLRLQSIIEPLLTSTDLSHALEAIVSSVSDLPDQDVIRVMRYATRLQYQPQIAEPNGTILANGTLGKHNTSENERRKQLRCKRLVQRCLEYRMDKEPAVQSLRLLPFNDVMMILKHLDNVLNCTSTGDATEDQTVLAKPSANLRNGKGNVIFIVEGAVTYRGVRNWIDIDKQTKRKRKANRMKGCISWICLTIDAHLSDLIVNEPGRELTSKLLEAVKERRKESECLKTLQGMTKHLTSQRGVPTGPDIMYSMKVTQVPRYAALL